MMMKALKHIADFYPDMYAIVFCRTRLETQSTASSLIQDGYNADALHGDLSQALRDEVMGHFRRKHLQILVATDVAARGLDVTDLTHIINYTLPDDPEVYIHRSGRTGRAGKSGISIAIIHTREMGKIKQIERKFKMSFNRTSVPTGGDICTKQLYTLIDKIEHVEVNETQIEPFLPAIYEKLEWLSREELIKHFVSAEFNRFLDYYKNARDINIAARPDRPERGRRGEKNERDDRGNVSFARIHVNVGSKQNLTPARMIGMINEALDSSAAKIGKIEIMKTVAFFEIDAAVSEELIEALTGWKIAGIPLQLELARQQASDRPPRRGRFGNSNNSGSGSSSSSGNKKNYRGSRRNDKKRSD